MDKSNLIERLRERRKLKYMANCKCGHCQCVHIDDVYAAADALTAASAREERLREALQAIVDFVDQAIREGHELKEPGLINQARAALQAAGGGEGK